MLKIKTGTWPQIKRYFVIYDKVYSKNQNVL